MSNIPFKIKLLTSTSKAPERANEGDLFDLFVDNFDFFNSKYNPNYGFIGELADFELRDRYKLRKKDRVLIKTGIAIELPIQYDHDGTDSGAFWSFKKENCLPIKSYAVADIRPRSGLALKHGITVLNSPGTIDNSYRKEIGIILYNAGHEPYTIKKGDKIAQMLIRPLYPSSFEVVKDFEDSGRGGFGSTGN